MAFSQHSLSQHYLLSEPVRVHWAGWETTTLALQQAGWALSAQQDVAMGRLRIALKHAEYRVIGMTETLEFDFIEHSRHPNMRGVVLRAQLAHQMHVQLMERELSFKPIDASPMMEFRERRSLDDLVLFAPSLVRTQEIIVPEPSVAELLEQILKLQEPAKNEYFKQLVAEERPQWDAKPRQKFHAQILSLVA